MMFFAFCISMFGFAFAVRTFKHFVTQELFDRAFMTRIGITYFVSVLILIFSMPTSCFSLWCALVFPFVILVALLSARVSRRARIFKSEALGILSILILKMKSGRSFRQSLNETVSECDRDARAKLSEIASVVAFSQQGKTAQRDPFMRELIEEFRVIDQQPHASLRRLTVLREKIRIEDEFRRRSGQVLARLRAQSLVMCALYLCVFIFMVVHFGWHANARALSASIVFFALGTLWMWVGGRNLTWKV